MVYNYPDKEKELMDILDRARGNKDILVLATKDIMRSLNLSYFRFYSYFLYDLIKNNEQWIFYYHGRVEFRFSDNPVLAKRKRGENIEELLRRYRAKKLGKK
jgi:hypothetical protein